MSNMSWGSTQRSSYPNHKMVPKSELSDRGKAFKLTSYQRKIIKKMHKKKVRASGKIL